MEGNEEDVQMGKVLYDDLARLEGVGGTPGGLALRFNGLDDPSVSVDGVIAIVEQVAIRRSTGPAEERAAAETSCCDISETPNIVGRVSASSVSTDVSSSLLSAIFVFLRVVLGVRMFGFLSVSSPLSTMQHISTITGAFSKMSIQTLTKYQCMKLVRIPCLLVDSLEDYLQGP